MIDVWQTVFQQQNNPLARSGHSSFILKTKNKQSLIIFGGLGQNEAFNDMYEFNIKQKIWKQIEYQSQKNIPSPRASCFCVYIKKYDQVYLFGGTGFKTFPVLKKFLFNKSDLFCFDFQDQAWNIINHKGAIQPPSERFGHTLNLYKQFNILYRQLILFGGVKINLINKKEQYEYLQDLYFFDIYDKTWISQKFDGPNPQARYRHSTIVYKDLLVVIGGGTHLMRFGNINILDMIKKQWSEINFDHIHKEKQIYQGRFGQACFINENQIFIFGGQDDFLQDNMVKYDMQTKLWKVCKQGGQKPEKTEFFSFCNSKDSLFVCGGRKGESKNLDVYTFKYKNEEDFDCDLKDQLLSFQLKNKQNQAEIQILCGENILFAHKILLKHRCKFLFDQINVQNVIYIIQQIVFSEEQFLCLKILLEYIYGDQIKTKLNNQNLRNFIIFICQTDLQQLIYQCHMDYLYFCQSLEDLENYCEQLQAKIGYNIVEKLIKQVKEIIQLWKCKTIVDQKKIKKDLNYQQIKNIDQFYLSLEKIKNDEEFTDFSIIVDDREFKIHSLFLTVRSQFFENLFESQLQETKERKIILDQKQKNNFIFFFNYFYSGKFDLLKQNNKLQDLQNFLLNCSYFQIKSQDLMYFLNQVLIFKL